jgi:hypothetical protein
VVTATEAAEIRIDSASSQLLADIFQLPSISYLSRCGLEAHYSIREGSDTPGFFSGDASNFDDLVCYWNLRAAGIPLLFVDSEAFGSVRADRVRVGQTDA